MEVACGEYGDHVPQLVVAVRSGRCAPFQSSSRTKVINLEKAVREKNAIDAKYLLENGLVIDDKMTDFDPNLESFIEMKESKMQQSYADYEANEDDSLKNEKLSFYRDGAVCLKQVQNSVPFFSVLCKKDFKKIINR